MNRPAYDTGGLWGYIKTLAVTLALLMIPLAIINLTTLAFASGAVEFNPITLPTLPESIDLWLITINF